MNIDKNNYQLFILDFLEDRLSGEEEVSIRKFLAMNPDIQDEVNSLETHIPEQKINFCINKSDLYKTFANVHSVTPENFEEFCIAYYEGDLDKRSAKLLEEYIKKQPSLEHLFLMHSKLHFSPDQNIKFQGKRSLRKYILTPAFTFRYSAILAAAASIILFLFLNINHGENSSPVSLHTQSLKNNEKPVKNDIYNGQNPDHLKDHALFNKRSDNSRDLFASIDSSNSRQYEKVVLASMQPKIPDLHNFRRESHTVLPAIKIATASIESLTASTVAIPQKSREIRTSKDRGIMETILHIGIKSINSLTENNLDLYTEKNSAGKLSEFALQNENFGITRKIGKNMQN
jgi:hypothetical protein